MIAVIGDGMKDSMKGCIMLGTEKYHRKISVKSANDDYLFESI